MRSSSTLVALALSIGSVVAGPAHASFHKKSLDQKDVDLSAVDWDAIDWKSLHVDWSTVNYPGSNSNNGGGSSSAGSSDTSTSSSAASAVQGAPSSDTSSVTPVSSSTVSVQSSDNDSDEFTGLFDGLWEDLRGCSNDRNEFGDSTASSGEVVSYISNYGKPYGSNMFLTDSKKDLTYSVTFINDSPKAMTINCWNKPGKDGQANSGATDAPKFTTLTFNLSVKQQAIVAIDENTVMACTEAVDRFHSSGAFGNTWVEFKHKKKDSGYNVSKILNTGCDYKVSISADEIPCVSSEMENNWTTETDTTGSGSCYNPHDTNHLTVTMCGC